MNMIEKQQAMIGLGWHRIPASSALGYGDNEMTCHVLANDPVISYHWTSEEGYQRFLQSEEFLTPEEVLLTYNEKRQITELQALLASRQIELDSLREYLAARNKQLDLSVEIAQVQSAKIQRMEDEMNRWLSKMPNDVLVSIIVDLVKKD